MSELRIDERTAVTYRQWNAPLPKAVLLLVHGLGAHGRRWNFLADFCLQNNISSYAIELRGFGETEGLRGDVENFNIYYSDIRSLCGIIRRENPDRKIFLIGESMGALISFLSAAQEPDQFSGIILLSPVFKSRLSMPSLVYFKIFFSLFYQPRKQFYVPFDSQMCTRDIAYQKIMDSEPQEHRLATARLLLAIVFSQVSVQFFKKRMRIPVLFLLAGKDTFSDTNSSRRFFQSLNINDKEIVLYPQMHHALSIELDREKVFEDMLKWIEIRI